ncbi:MAG: hypothetical protein ABUS79_03995 [Pseudomonadota bacterium]
MPGIFKEWTVLPHGKVTRLEDNLLTVTGDLPMPIGDFPRRMTVARLGDGRLVIFSAIALDETEMRALEAWGRPTYLVVPNERHRKDAYIWKARYPELIVVAPPGAREKVAEIVPVDATSVDFGDPDVTFAVVPGTDECESALIVKTSGRTTLVVNEIIWNVDDRPGFGGWLFHLIGFTGDDPKIPVFVAAKSIKDRPALKAQLERWADIPSLTRVVVSHGDIIDKHAPAVLRALAAKLA